MHVNEIRSTRVLLKPYDILKVKNTLPKSLYYVTEYIISSLVTLNSFNRLVFLVDVDCVLCEVETELYA